MQEANGTVCSETLVVMRTEDSRGYSFGSVHAVLPHDPLGPSTAKLKTDHEIQGHTRRANIGQLTLIGVCIDSRCVKIRVLKYWLCNRLHVTAQLSLNWTINFAQSSMQHSFSFLC